MHERLLNRNQSCFQPSDSCVNQLLAITREICKGFNCNSTFDVTSVVLGMSKAFDKVWQKDLLYMPMFVVISGELYNLLEKYLSGRFQRVVLNRQTSSWRPILAGVSQRPVQDPLFFNFYVNDLLNELKSNAKLFAEDMSLLTIVHYKNESDNVLNNDLLLISKWAGKYFLIQILANQLKKCYFQENSRFKFIRL